MVTQWIVDAFTDTPFKGNSAAVIIVDDYPSEEWMQSIAKENNLSETAFIKRLDSSHYHIRWFSPLTEIDFCGHATLASAYILYHQVGHQGEICFSTNEVGDLFVKPGGEERIEMSFPVRTPEPVDVIPEQLIKGLTITPRQVLRSDQAYFAIYDKESDVTDLATDNQCLRSLAPFDVVVTAKSESLSYDFVSRYFWPANGGDEDPVTGSIHAGLMPYWAKQLNKRSLTALQASERTGVLYGELVDDRVIISGNAVLFAKATLFV